MTTEPYLIIGLGNPGREYRETRHNIGFMLLDRLAVKLNARFTRLQSKALIASTAYQDRKVILAKPQTFMNLSGQSAQGLVHFYKIPLDRLLVAHDDLDLPPGTIRIRPDGGSAGQRGMGSILERFGTDKFPRLRMGCGPVPPRVDAAEFVLAEFFPEEEAAVDAMKNEVATAQQKELEQAKETRPYWEAKRKLEDAQHFRQVLYQKISQEETDIKLPKSSMVEIVEQATPGMKPVKPNKPLNIALGIVIGIVVGVGLAFFIEYLDTSVKTIDDVERALGSPVLGVIPQNVGMLSEEGSESPHAEAYRVLRTNLLFSRKDDKLNTVAVVSAGAGEGKSTTVFNLAVVFAQSGQRVLVDHFFQPLAMFKYALHRQGIDYSSIEAIDAGDVAAIEEALNANPE